MKTALVVGASGGIGRATVERFLEGGFHVVAVSRDAGVVGIDDARLDAVEGDLGTERGRALIVERSPAALDVVVHVAGVNPREPLESMSEDALRGAFEVNFFAPVLLTQALAPRITEGGAVVFVTSTLAERAAPGALAYAASKAALEGAMRVLSLELGARGARALAVSPGLVDTEMMRAGRSADEQRALAALSPLGRVGAPREIAELIFAASTNAFVTGAVFRIDGGMSAGFPR